jgi:Coenzyme PQQ synthesis protein D (PqqD)
MANYKIAPDILSKTVDDEEVIVDLKSGTYFGLNPTATVIWKQVKAGSHPEIILQVLTEQFDASEDELKQDMHSFFTELESLKMVSLL